MQRFGMMIRLKAGSATTYKRYHAAVWPEVLDKILECNIRNYSIYFKDDLLFSYFEYHGCDLKSDWKKMDSHAKTQEWWGLSCSRCRNPCPRGKRVSGGQRWRKFFISIKALLNPKTYFPDTAWVRPCCKGA